MLLITHIIIALSSLALTSFAYMLPSKTKLRVSAGLVALTTTSGIMLMIVEPNLIARTCLSGIAYIIVASIGLAFVRARLASESIET